MPIRFFLFFLICLSVTAKAAVPTFAEVRSGFHSSYAQLLDRNGELLQARRIDMSVNRLEWVPLAEISPALTEAAIFAEDRDFYRHHGIDWGATARATLQFLSGDRSRGASTISMQLAGLLDADLRWHRGGRSVSQKWRQMRYARALEKTWSKAQILEAWLNLVTFRGDLQGVAAASQALFDKAPAGLGRREGLLLAALLPAPSAVPKQVVRHACALLAGGFTGTDCQSLRDLAFATLDRRQAPFAERPSLAALSARLLQQPEQKLRTTLDAALQRQVEEILSAQLAQLQDRHVNAGAVLVLDNASGEARAYVANAGAVDSARFVDGVQALRQAGSTLKPFLYGLAFERRYLTAASVLEDAPLSLATPSGLYSPQNYEKDFKGPVSARLALASSLNVPAVRVLDLVGIEDFWAQLRRLGFDSLTEAPEFYGYSLALGSGDISLWMLANAYRSLANGGRYGEAVLVATPPREQRQVYSPETAFLVADILSDRSARVATFGLENVLATPFWSAVKTGTSKDMRDNWCVGFSSRYTVAVWVGNLDGAPMHDVSGITGAGPVWAAVMQRLEGERLGFAAQEPPAPPGLARSRVEFVGLSEPAREEWFLPGTRLRRVEYVAQTGSRILYPANETLVAVDPDIPDRHQRVRFRAEVLQPGAQWWLDGRRLGPARNLDWRPVAGTHRLVLRDAAGRRLDAVLFKVRGQTRRR